jgi:transforming growth factor-beta-induced protein
MYSLLGNIAEIVAGDVRLTMWLAVLKAAGLDKVLSGEGPFTIFAPTDEAFAKLAKGTLRQWLLDKVVLKQVLLYHVASGRLSLSELVRLRSVHTLVDRPLRVFAEDGALKLNEAAVLSCDIEASNGMIHIIDSILIHPQSSEEL